MRAIRYLLLLLVSGSAHLVSAQVVGTLSSSAANESFFLYEVKLVDEFIERFNDDPSSYIRQQSKTLYGTDSMISRSRLLKSLFDKKHVWGAELPAFISAVTAPAHPAYIHFTDSNWYAEEDCVFLHNGKKVVVPLILHIKTVDGASKWMIAGIGNSDMTAAGSPAPPYKATAGSSGGFIPTSSYGTDFVVFNSIFAADMREADYFEPPLLATPRAQALIALIKQGKCTFQYVKSSKYHFFQVPGWVLTVTHFKRKDTNSGWLVSGLRAAAEADKQAQIKKLLYP
jgi:hypothetical protein